MDASILILCFLGNFHFAIEIEALGNKDEEE